MAEFVDEITTSDRFPFTEIEGLKVRMRDNATALDFVELYLTDQIMEHIVIETNRFANTYRIDHPAKADNGYLSKWTDITLPELKKFFGLVILMGIVHKPSIHDYWSTDDLYWTPIFSKSMTRDRFYLILKFFHFNNNNDPSHDPNNEDRDRLHKIRPILKIVRDRLQRVYNPVKCLSVEESLVLFKCRLHFKQYIRTKRARFQPSELGIKCGSKKKSRRISYLRRQLSKLL